jgi:hypothetical protein
MSTLKYWVILGFTLVVCIISEQLARHFLESYGHAIVLGVLFAAYANVFHYVESKKYPNVIYIGYRG